MVIGLDGFDPTITERLLASGALPHLSALRETGGYARVATTYPAQTPVAWSTFATGLNPGGHGIFDFLRRDPETYGLDLALNRYEQKSSFLPAGPVNLRRGTPLWEILANEGIPSTVLRCPCSYPPGKSKGKILSGMGVPDLRGGLGTSTFYTERSVEARESEQVFRLKRDSGIFRSVLVGPRNPKKGEDATIDLILRPEGSDLVVISDGEPSELRIRPGEWSAWLKVKFKLGMLQSVRGVVRFHLIGLDPVELYASPVNFDPSTPMFPISSPWDYAGELERAIGTFYTTGMVEDHNGLVNERLDETAFLDQCGQVLVERETMLEYADERLEEGFLYCLFDTPDRIQHMFWRFTEPDHPANRDREFRREFERVIESHYRECDAIVGRAVERADEETLVIVLSDHGFGSFQRGVNLNTWLHDRGYLALRPDARPGSSTGEMLDGIDWARTRAYAVGLGSIYLNLEGRESEGVVKATEKDELATEIVSGLRGLEDPERDAVAIRDVKTREQLWTGAHANDSPDLLVLFGDGYRASWATGLGGVPEGWFENNVRKWGGDHIIDPTLVPGILFMNHPFAGEGATLLDLAPSVLDALGVPERGIMEGKSLLP